MSTTKDSRTEAWLTRMGVKWRYSNAIKPPQLAKGWDGVNISRPKAQVDAAIADYGALMEAGSAAPAPILWKTPKGYAVLDGVQRICALVFLLNVSEFSAYIIETDSDLLATTIRVLANAQLQGHPTEMKWTKRMAVQTLMVDKGMSAKEVRALTNWKHHEIERLYRILTKGFELRCAGGPSEGLSDGIILAIDEHSAADDIALAPKPIVNFCHDLKKGKFTNGSGSNSAIPHIKAFFVDINRKKGAKPRHKQFDERHREFRRDPEVNRRLAGRPTTKETAEIKLGKTLKQTLTITKDLLKNGAAIPYMEEFFQLWNQVDSNLKSLAKNKVKAK